MFRSMQGLLAHARPFWPYYLVGATAVVGTNVCDLATTFVVRYAVNAIHGQPSSDALGAALDARWPLADERLVALGCAFVALIVLQGTLRYVWRWGFIFSSLKIARDLRRALIVDTFAQDHAHFDHAQTGEMISVATADVEAMRMFLGIGLLLVVDNVLYFAMVPFAMFAIDWQLTLMVMAPLPLIPFVTRSLNAEIHARFTRCQEELAKLAAFTQEAMAGIGVTKAFVQEERQIEAFREKSRAILAEQVRLARVQAVFNPVWTLFVGIEVVLVLLLGGQRLVDGRLDTGQLYQMLMMTLMLTFPMMGLGWTLSLLQRGIASEERYRAATASPPRIADDPARIDRSRAVVGKVELRGTTFTYAKAAAPALVGVDLVIEAGRTVGITGPVGAGKSPLARLVPRFYEAPEGQVLIDGADVRDWPLATLRRSVGFVSQTPFIFSASIADNIALGMEAPDRAAVERAAECAGLLPDVAGFPRGFDTLLGERGVNLSGGQRQRLALARAIATNPRILVLDDCLSAVDTRTEELIKARLREMMVGRTCLVIAHRLSTLMDADAICVLDAGRVVELGSHAALVARGGWYAETFRQQQLEAEREHAPSAAAAGAPPA